jgi:hypothetical protein
MVVDFLTEEVGVGVGVGAGELLPPPPPHAVRKAATIEPAKSCVIRLFILIPPFFVLLQFQVSKRKNSHPSFAYTPLFFVVKYIFMAPDMAHNMP